MSPETGNQAKNERPRFIGATYISTLKVKGGLYKFFHGLEKVLFWTKNNFLEVLVVST
jgi:hypothetical protein